MYTIGIDSFFHDVDQVNEVKCKVCNSTCTVSRSVYGPTSYIAALAKIYKHHDEFKCPHADTDWHYQAVELYLALKKLPGKRISAIINKDIRDIVDFNLSKV